MSVCQKIFTVLSGVVFLWVLTGCASTAKQGLNRPLDYSTPTAAKLTDAYLRQELSAEQQRQFYQAAVFLCAKDFWDKKDEALSQLYEAVRSFDAREPMSGDTRSDAPDDFEKQFTDALSKRFNGKTPAQVIAQGRAQGAFEQDGGLEALGNFLKAVQQFGQSAEAAGL